jgi:hypothetical protein
MARYESKLKVSCWKERTCCSCGRQYKYFFSQWRLGHGRSPDDADVDAVEKYVAALDKETDLSPCPNCGRYQPEMIGSLRFRWHGLLMLATALWIVPLLIASLGMMPRWLAMVLTANLAIALLLVHALIQSIYPNHGTQANKTRAASLMKQDRVRLLPEASDKTEAVPPAAPRTGGVFWLMLLVALGSLILLPTCEVVRRWNAWPVNPGWVPEVVGPGDGTWIYTKKTIHSLQGHWTGSAAATLEPLDQKGKSIPVQAATRDDNWGNFISFKPGEEAKRSTVWVSIRVPDDARLEGKECRVLVAMTIAYPEIDPLRKDQFLIKEEFVQHTEVVQLAPRGAGSTFLFAWYAGMLLPLMPLLILQMYCLLRADHLKRAGNVKTVVSSPKRLKDEADMDEPLPPPPPTSNDDRYKPRDSKN